MHRPSSHSVLPALVVTTFLAAACVSPEPPGTGTGPRTESAALAETLTVRAGESRWVMSGKLHVTFEGVEQDSRCPSNVNCVHMGDATMRFRLRHPDGSERVLLNLSEEPRVARLGGLTMEVLELSPYPVDGQPTPPDRYVSRIRISAT